MSINTHCSPLNTTRKALQSMVFCWFITSISLVAGFEIKGGRDARQHITVVVPGVANYYHEIQSAPALNGSWHVVAILSGTNGPQSWTNSISPSSTVGTAFFRVLRIPRSQPLDADNDGIDDLYELKWPFLNPLDASDGRKDQDGDGLFNIGEYTLGTSPIDSDTDGDWVSDGYEVSRGSDPKNSASAPPLEFRINSNALYTSNTAVNLDFGPHIAEQVALSESPDMAAVQVRSFTRTMSYTFVNKNNGWRVLYLQYRRNGGKTASPVISRGINLDTVPPVLTIDSPVNGSVTNLANVRIEGSVSDETPVQVTINGERADGIVAGCYMRDAHPLITGDNQIVVVAVDAAGNRTSRTVRCTLDSRGDVTPPGLVLDLPLDHELSGNVTNWYDRTTLGEDDQLLLHAVVNKLGISAVFTVIGAEGINGPYTGAVAGTDVWARIALFPGTNSLSWVVSDTAGNQRASSRTVIRDTNIVFRITSPVDMAVQNQSSVTVSGIASAIFRKASVTVNGRKTVVTDHGDHVSFTTISPVPLNVGLTPLSAVALLAGRSYQADPRVTGYEVTRWHHDYEHTYYGLDAPDDSGYTVYHNQWIRDDTWEAKTKALVERRINHLVHTDYWYPGGSDTKDDTTDNTNTTGREAPVTSGFFGVDDVRDQYVAYSVRCWDHDHVATRDQVTFVKYDEKKERQTVILQFDDLAYLGNPNDPPALDPAAITFWGQRGFWYKDHVSFLVPIETFRTYTITEADFTWPSFQFSGPRTDMQNFYTDAQVASTRHIIQFSGLHNEIIRVTLITPAGDPVDAAVQSGDGQNEFSYSVASPGVLTMNLKAQVTPSGIADQIKDQCVFTVDSMVGSTLAWDARNPGGKPTVSGEMLLAVVTFTGLPANNIDFGNKKARVFFNASIQDERTYEVFYPKNAANHPGGQAGSPNWFHYWGQTVQTILHGDPKPLLLYDSASFHLIGEDWIHLSDGDAGSYTAPLGGNNPLSGIDNFAWTAVHESDHYARRKENWNNSPSIHFAAQGGSGPDDDRDNDYLPNRVEDVNLNGIFDPPTEIWDWLQALTPGVPDPALKNDFEWKNCLENKDAKGDHSLDWGDPGMKHKTKNRYDD